MKRTFWETRLGGIMCAVITNNDHVFSGWSHPKHATRPGEPLPFAYCERCGREF